MHGRAKNAKPTDSQQILLKYVPIKFVLPDLSVTYNIGNNIFRLFVAKSSATTNPIMPSNTSKLP